MIHRVESSAVLQAIAAVVATTVLLGGLGCSPPEAEPPSVEAEIRNGHNDVIFDASGRVQNGRPQWARDASVAIMLNHDFWCSGTLVSPRVVLTNAHCMRPVPVAGYQVWFGPVTPRGPGGPLPGGTPAHVEVEVVGCFMHPESGASCFDGGDPRGGDLEKDRDLAALVLAERIDVGVSGRRTTRYRALPAQIVAADEACGGPEDPNCWTDDAVRHVGYSATNDSGDFSLWRQYASQHVSTGNLTVEGWSAALQLWGDHGVGGDSGGGVFLVDATPDGRQRLLSVHRGSYADLDVSVRLTWGGNASVQGWLATVLGANPSYSGTNVSIPGVGSVWTGDVDVPPRTEPAERAAFGVAHGVDPEAIDSDGDGLVDSHDNCWGFYNPGQLAEDATRLCCTNGGGPALRAACAESCPLPPAAPTAPATTTLASDVDCNANNVPDVCEPADADSDGDSVIDVCDNCPNDRNTSQSDCNADAIAAINAHRPPGTPEIPAQGDACDAQPCGETRIREDADTHSGSWTISRTVRFDLVEVDARVGSSPLAARTGYRFCQCLHSLFGTRPVTDSTRSRVSCEAMIGGDPTNGGCNLYDNLGTYDQVPSEPLPWRWVSLTPTAASGTPDPPRTENPLTYALPVSPFHADRAGHWAVGSHDIPRWEATFPDDDFSSFVAGDGLTGVVSGVFWTHTPGPASGGLYADAERRRRSHYWSGEIAAPYTTIPILMRPTLISPFVFRGGWYGSQPFVVRVPAFGNVSEGPMLLSNNAGVPRSALTYLFEFEGKWTAASEPDGLIFEGDGVRHVALDEEGHVTVVLAEIGGALADADGTKCPGVSSCPGGASFLSGRMSGEPVLGARYADLDLVTPGLLVLSARRQRLWRVTGSGSPKTTGGDLATYDPSSETWAVQPIPALGDVLAAVYSPREGAIWVLDEVESGQGNIARLLALWPETGRSVIAKSWSRSSPNTIFAVALDPEGRLYIAGSDGKDHAVALVDVSLDGGEHVYGVYKADGLIEPGMIRATADGVALPIDRGDHYDVATYRASDFLSGQMGGSLSWVF